VVGAWGGDGPADLNRDGVVDSEDLALVLGQFGAVPTARNCPIDCLYGPSGCFCGAPPGGGGDPDGDDPPDDGDQDPGDLAAGNPPTDDGGGGNPDGGGGSPPGGGGCGLKIRGPERLIVGDGERFSLGHDAASAISWAATPPGQVTVDPADEVRPGVFYSAHVTGLEYGAVLTLVATITVNGEVCLVDKEITVAFEIAADQNLDGVIDEADAAVEQGERALITANYDRQNSRVDPQGLPLPDALAFDESGLPHQENRQIEGDPDDRDDIVPLRIRALGGLPPTWRAVLHSFDAQSMHVYPRIATGEDAVWGSLGDRVPVPGGGPSQPEPDEFEITHLLQNAEEITLGVESMFLQNDVRPETAFNGAIGFILRIWDENEEFHTESEVKHRVYFEAAPWLMPSHRDPVARVFTTDVVPARDAGHAAGPAPSFLDRLTQALAGTGVPIEVIPSDPTDRWPQDQIEIGFQSRPLGQGEHVQHVALSSPRQRTLTTEMARAIPREGLGLYRPVTSHENQEPFNTYDSFGNLEALPPTEQHPDGLIYYGTELMHTQIRRFIDWQRGTFGLGQHRRVLDTSWLLVGHVDEIISVQMTGPDTFRVILASPQMAIDLLEADPGHLFDEAYLWV